MLPGDWCSTSSSAYIYILSLSLCLWLVQEIDGEAFLLLSQADLVRSLRLKLGPALKVHSCILRFRNHLPPS